MSFVWNALLAVKVIIFLTCQVSVKSLQNILNLDFGTNNDKVKVSRQRKILTLSERAFFNTQTKQNAERVKRNSQLA
jgi:hypothetical protein